MNHLVYDGPYEVTNGLFWADAYGKVIRMLLRQTLPVTIGEFLYGQCDCSGDDYLCQIENWRQLKSFIDSNYPHVEIILVNPVSLTGLFESS